MLTTARSRVASDPMTVLGFFHPEKSDNELDSNHGKKKRKKAGNKLKKNER